MHRTSAAFLVLMSDSVLESWMSHKYRSNFYVFRFPPSIQWTLERISTCRFFPKYKRKQQFIVPETMGTLICGFHCDAPSPKSWFLLSGYSSHIPCVFHAFPLVLIWSSHTHLHVVCKGVHFCTLTLDFQIPQPYVFALGVFYYGFFFGDHMVQEPEKNNQ